MSVQQFSLCWDNFQKNMSTGMLNMLEAEDLVDVTIAVEGKYLKAHKMILSVCSPYFKELFQTNPCQHPIIFMKDVCYQAMSDLLTFMYKGEVHISQDTLPAFIKIAESLQIKGLTSDDSNDTSPTPHPSTTRSRSTSSPTPQITTTSSSSATVAKNTTPRVVKRQSSTDAKRPSSLANNNSSSTGGAKSGNNNSAKKVKLSSSVTSSGKVEDGGGGGGDEELIKFKMEPFEGVGSGGDDEEDGEQTIDDDNTMEQYADEGDDTANEGNDDDDYTNMESLDDSQLEAGTSGDGADGDSQDFKMPIISRIQRKMDMPRYIVDGFVFHVNIMKGNPPMTYLRCLEYKRLGCHARAVMPTDGTIQDIQLTQTHNHPPDYAAEEKIVFMRELKDVMLKHVNMTTKEVYELLKPMYPTAARETPFDTIKNKMSRWRRVFLFDTENSDLKEELE